jgi:hypothetical protein
MKINLIFYKFNILNCKISFNLIISFFFKMNNFLVLSPLDQFEIRDLINVNFNILNNNHISITNIGLYLIISIIIILGISQLASHYNKLISNT